MSFAENLKKIRKERNITQEQLAEMLSVSRQAVSKWESGIGYPETEKLLIISKELNVSLDFLLLDENVMQEKTKESLVNVPNGKITITSFDGKNIVTCHKVKSTNILFPGKNEPKYILYAVDNVTFWGEHTTILGFYKSLEDINQEINDISKAINAGICTYELRYAAEIEYKGFFQQPKLK